MRSPLSFGSALALAALLGSSAVANQEPQVEPSLANQEVTLAVGVSPLGGFGQEEWGSRPSLPVMRVIGSGSPELLVYLADGRPSVGQAAWIQRVGDSLQAGLAKGSGTIHLLVDAGPGAEAEGEPRDTYPTLEQDAVQSSALGVLQNPSERYLASYFLAHPKITGITGFHFPRIEGLTVAGAREPEPVPKPSASSGSLEQFVATGLGIYLTKELQVESKDESWYRLEGSLVWRLGHPDPEAQPGVATPVLTGDSTLGALSDWEREHQGERLEVSASTKTPATAAADLLSKLRDEAQLGITNQLSVEAMGGNLWQVELTLRAPKLQITPLDPKRTYPRDSFEVNLDWGPATGADGQGALPALAYLAWRPQGGDHFELLQGNDGRFRFPAGNIPDDVSLRLVIQADGGSGRLMGLSLGSRLYGDARAEFVAAAIGEQRPAAPKVQSPPVEEKGTVPVQDPDGESRGGR